MTIDEYHLLYDFDIRIQYYHGCEMVHITSYNCACLRHDAAKNNSMGDVWSLDNGFWLDVPFFFKNFRQTARWSALELLD